MNYHNIVQNDLMNGPGLRVTLFVSGCDHHCKGCQNPQTWDYDSGIPFDEPAMFEIIQGLQKEYITGLTISGGDPFAEKNISTILDIVNRVRDIFGDQKSIWIYTGYTMEELMARNDQYTKSILKSIDGLVDGEYVESLRDTSAPWVGSVNQRVFEINVLTETIPTNVGPMESEYINFRRLPGDVIESGVQGTLVTSFPLNENEKSNRHDINSD